MKRLISSLLALSLLLSCLPMGTRAAGANVEVLYPSSGENTGSPDSIYGDMIANSPTLPNLEPTISGSMGTLEPSVPGELIPAIPLPTVPGGGLAPETDDTTPATLPIPPEIDDVPATGGGSQTEPTLPAAPTEPPMPDEDFEIDDVPKTDGELEQDEVGNWYFRTFAQLKELCSMTFDTPATAYYEGPEDFILSANLAIPANLTVDFSWMNQTPGTVTIPAGVSLISETHTFNDEECMCGADELMDLSAMLHVTGLAFHALNVEGNLSVKEMMVYDSLNVTGKVYNHGTIEFADGASISGEENIIHSTEDSLLYIEKRADDTASLKAAIELVKSQTTPHKRFNLRLLGDVTIDADVTVPAGCDFEIGVAFLKIAPGVTLTLDTYTTIICNTTVEGTLVNNGGILLHECYWNAPRVTIAQGGAYRGNGKIVIHDNNTNESSEMFTNLDLNQFTITASDPANHYWVLEKKASSDELYQDADGNWHFFDFDDLKKLADRTYTAYTIASYCGNEDLVISKNLTLPENLYLKVQNMQTEIIPDPCPVWIFPDSPLPIMVKRSFSVALNSPPPPIWNGVMTIIKISPSRDISVGSLWRLLTMKPESKFSARAKMNLHSATIGFLPLMMNGTVLVVLFWTIPTAEPITLQSSPSMITETFWIATLPHPLRGLMSAPTKNWISALT